MIQLQEGRIRQEDTAKHLKISIQQASLAAIQSPIEFDFLQEAIDIIGLHYRDNGPTFATEKLLELHQIKLSVETVRKNLIALRYWHAQRRQIARNQPVCERRTQGKEGGSFNIPIICQSTLNSKGKPSSVRICQRCVSCDLLLE